VGLLNIIIDDVFNIKVLRPFQIEVINHLTSKDDTYIVIVRATAEGKSLVPQATAVLRKGVAIIVVPLHGLGSDQVEKANIPDQGIEAYYVDEHKRADACMLRDRLLSLTKYELDHSSIILFVSPNALAADSPWYTDVFMKLAKRGFLSFFALMKPTPLHRQVVASIQNLLTPLQMQRQC